MKYINAQRAKIAQAKIAQRAKIAQAKIAQRAKMLKELSLSRKLELEFLTNLSLAMKKDGNEEKEETTENCEHREAKT